MTIINQTIRQNIDINKSNKKCVTHRFRYF